MICLQKLQSTYHSFGHAEVFSEVHLGFLKTRCANSPNLSSLADEAMSCQGIMCRPEHTHFPVGEC
jgi:hypothetical protein